jgi:hypothetical protein
MKVPVGALTDMKQIKRILRHKRDTPLFIAPGWVTSGQWVNLNGDLIRINFSKHTYARNRTIYQVRSKELYFDQIVFVIDPFRILEAYTNDRYIYWLKDWKRRFIFTNYFHAYGFTLRSNHAGNALYPGVQ